ncbi:MAG: sigma-70 family RNA polymerase sigma factor [Candidatus Schekmanbacteria bacterium]|nr:sigma-70 family RNA polymerase sigma factor [Candidatus Schekmanbacteria bacterium]
MMTSDIQLMECVRDDACLATRDDAFRELIRRHQKGVHHYLYRLTGSYDTALELTQETFLRVFANRRSYQPVAAFTTWLYRIATNLGINESRLARNRYERQFLAAADSSDDSPEDWLAADREGETPEDSTWRQQLRERLSDQLANIPETFRIPVLLKDLLGFSYEEIGEVTATTVGTVKSRIHRGRKMAAQMLLNQDPETFQAFL